MSTPSTVKGLPFTCLNSLLSLLPLQKNQILFFLSHGTTQQISLTNFQPVFVLPSPSKQALSVPEPLLPCVPFTPAMPQNSALTHKESPKPKKSYPLPNLDAFSLPSLPSNGRFTMNDPPFEEFQSSRTDLGVVIDRRPPEMTLLPHERHSSS